MMMRKEGRFPGDMMMEGPPHPMHHPHPGHHGMKPHDKKGWDHDGIYPQHKARWGGKHHHSFSGRSSSSSDSADEEEPQINDIMIEPIPEMEKEPDVFDIVEEDPDFIAIIEDNPENSVFESEDEPAPAATEPVAEEEEETDILKKLESEMAQSEEKVSRMEESP
jgi:hypothetical protein